MARGQINAIVVVLAGALLLSLYSQRYAYFHDHGLITRVDRLSGQAETWEPDAGWLDPIAYGKYMRRPTVVAAPTSSSVSSSSYMDQPATPADIDAQLRADRARATR